MACTIVFVFSSCHKDKVKKNDNGGASQGITTVQDTLPAHEDSVEDGIIENAVTDVDGNAYKAVKLGDQVRMAENLRTTKFADGTAIVLGSSLSSTTPYRYCPNNHENYVSTYGYLYNWPALMHNSASSNINPSRVQGICPNGWHVPSDVEWIQLTMYVKKHFASPNCMGTDDENQTSCIAKAFASTTGWDSSTRDYTPGNDPSSNNASGFAALSAGFYDGSSQGFGHFGEFWTATCGSGFAFTRYLYSIHANVYNGYVNRYHGLSVRCVRD